MKKLNLPYTSLVAIIAILILAIVALLKGIDSGLVAGSVAAIAGLGGYAIGKARNAK